MACKATHSGGTETLEVIQNYCANELLSGLIKPDTGTLPANVENTDEFMSFLFSVFKFPDSEQVDFECTITVCHQEVVNCFGVGNDGTCNGTPDPLWTTTPSSGRKRRENNETNKKEC